MIKYYKLKKGLRNELYILEFTESKHRSRYPNIGQWFKSTEGTYETLGRLYLKMTPLEYLQYKDKGV